MKYKIVDSKETCPKCGKMMERRKRTSSPPDKSYFYTEWDYCLSCKHVQHYEEYKSTVWQEEESRDNFFKYL